MRGSRPGRRAGACDEAGVALEKLDHVAFYDKPLVKFERLFETYLEYAPRGFASFRKAMPLWISDRLWMSDRIGKDLGWDGKVLFGDHHESHAASAFYPSPYEEAAVLTMDGVGEWATSSIGYGRGSALDMISEMRFPHSIGLLYSAFTYFCGFKVNSGEYKLMGLAPYGEPKYADVIREKLVHVCEDGSIRLEHGVLLLRDGPHDDGRGVRAALRRAGARARVEAHAARDGPRAVDPGRDRGDRPQDGAAREEDDRRDECSAWRAASL